MSEGKTQITVALIGVAGVISAALIANIDKISRLFDERSGAGSIRRGEGADTNTIPIAPSLGENGSSTLPIDWSSADPSKGEIVYRQCAPCHSISPGGPDATGPNLFGILGSPIADRPNFLYSEALKAKGGNWSFEVMDAWLKNPVRFAKGNKMSSPGLPDSSERANLIVYINAQGSNLPLPASRVTSSGSREADLSANLQAEVVLVAKSPVWVRISDARNQVLFENIMAEGQRYVLPPDINGPKLRAARAEAISVLVGGKELAPLGPAGTILTDIEIDIASLSDR